MTGYLRPATLDEAVAALAAGPRTPIAGGTDIYPARIVATPDEDLLDLTAIAALRGITADAAGWRFGAATTWTDVIEAALPPLFDGLKAAAREVGGVQIQNAGTLGGNLCNASPAADGAPNWLALDAEIELASAAGTRLLPVRDFLLGNRRTARRPDEILTAIRVPRPESRARGVFLKLGARRYLVISIVSVAAAAQFEADGRIASARIAVGACSPVPVRLPALESRLAGRHADPALVEPADLAPIAPIDDVRGTAAYRRDAALTLVRRALAELAR
ncbi:FAD binding domain-containing protein [Elioraea sp.]|uniref:FAD binding domain-containing protein n=1 Tax=Elioraea sp. TaxID=2185103 RepID=UPI00307EDDFE